MFYLDCLRDLRVDARLFLLFKFLLLDADRGDDLGLLEFFPVERRTERRSMLFIALPSLVDESFLP